MLEYKGYFGTVEVNMEDGVLHGQAINTHDVITYVAETPKGLGEEFITSVDVYLESCSEDGVEPNIVKVIKL